MDVLTHPHESSLGREGLFQLTVPIPPHWGSPDSSSFKQLVISHLESGNRVMCVCEQLLVLPGAHPKELSCPQWVGLLTLVDLQRVILRGASTG